MSYRVTWFRWVRAFAPLALAGLAAGCSTMPPPGPADYRLAAPQSDAERTYLGLPAEASSFLIEDTRSEVLVVDCFDMYCHLCQTGAKHVNELYKLAQERGLGERVKFIGLGVGDTPLEVATWKEKFKVPFPVFPDRRSIITKSLGELRLPNLIVLRNQGARLEVIHRSPGPLRNPADVLSHIQAGLSKAALHSWTDPVQAMQPTCGKSPRSSSCSDTASSSDEGSGFRPATAR